MLHIGQKIKHLREFNNFTQEYVAEQLGITAAGYSRIERDEVSINIEKLTKLSAILKVDASYLLDEKEKATIQFKSDNNSGVFCQNYFAEKDLYAKLIDQLTQENIHLKEEIVFLRSLVR